MVRREPQSFEASVYNNKIVLCVSGVLYGHLVLHRRQNLCEHRVFCLDVGFCVNVGLANEKKYGRVVRGAVL